MDFKEELAKKAGQTADRKEEGKADGLPKDNGQGTNQPVEKKPSVGRLVLEYK